MLKMKYEGKLEQALRTEAAPGASLHCSTSSGKLLNLCYLTLAAIVTALQSRKCSDVGVSMHSLDAELLIRT